MAATLNWYIGTSMNEWLQVKAGNRIPVSCLNVDAETISRFVLKDILPNMFA